MLCRFTQYAKAFLERKGMEAGKLPLLEAIVDDLTQTYRITPLVSDFKLEQLPAHLTMNFKVIDENGRQLDMGRNLATLRSQLGADAQKSFQAVAAKDAMVAEDLGEEITSWSFGELPEIMEIKRKNLSLIGHPSLVDRTTHCSLEVFDDPDEAQRQHHKGLLRLVRLQLKEQVKYVEKNLKTLQTVQMQAGSIPVLAKAFDSFEAMREAVVIATLEQTALYDPWPVDEVTFKEHIDSARARLNLIAQEISRMLTEIVSEVALVVKRLKAMNDKAVVADIEQQMQALFPKGFLQTVPYTQLRHYPRYLKAIMMRLEKWQDEQVRDATKMKDIQRFVTLYERELVARKGVVDERLGEFRWLIEELRVSLFAQKLRTPMPVSVKRLEKVWNSLLY